MRHRQRIVAEGDWHGEFGDYDLGETWTAAPVSERNLF
jgi:hypothetical protein